MESIAPESDDDNLLPMVSLSTSKGKYQVSKINVFTNYG